MKNCYFHFRLFDCNRLFMQYRYIYLESYTADAIYRISFFFAIILLSAIVDKEAYIVAVYDYIYTFIFSRYIYKMQ